MARLGAAARTADRAGAPRDAADRPRLDPGRVGGEPAVRASAVDRPLHRRDRRQGHDLDRPCRARVAPDIYISHYPALDLDHSPEEFARLFRATPDNNVKGHFQPSYAFESADWCPADARVDFHTYDAPGCARTGMPTAPTTPTISPTATARSRWRRRSRRRSRARSAPARDGALLAPAGQSRPVGRRPAARARRDR